jgi:capsular polysaccharide biosynthesis protein
MTHHEVQPLRVRHVLRWWPLIVLPAIIAVAAAYWSVSHQSPSYTAATRLAIIPLAQWDETFLGTSLIRDGGDAHSTATTTAQLLDSPRAAAVAAASMGGGWTPESVDRAVKVSAVPDSNVVEVAVQSQDPKVAQQVSEDFARAVLDDRWRMISAELDARIAAVSAITPADPNAGEASARLQTLILIRQAGADPTLRIDSTGAAVEDPQLPLVVVLGLAALGGAAVGVLCAMAAVRLRRARTEPDEPAAAPPERDPEPAPAFTPDGAG